MKHLFAFLENILKVSLSTYGHADYQKHEFERVKIYPFRILSEAILHLCWNTKLLPKAAKKIKCISNFQGILNRMLQVLHHYCRKQHRKNKNSLFIEQNVVITFCLLSINCVSCFSPYSTVEFLGSWTWYFAEILQIFNFTSDQCSCRK